MFKTLRKLGRDRRGATAIEYGLIAALIAVAIAGTAGTVGSSLSAKFTAVDNKINGK